MTPLSKKLQLKPDQVLVLVNEPETLMETLPELLAPHLIDTRPDADATAILVFATSLDEATRLAEHAFSRVGEEGLVWIAYPKGNVGDINRDKLWKALDGSGWRPVRQVAIDNVWSAMRFRPADA